MHDSPSLPPAPATAPAAGGAALRVAGHPGWLTWALRRVAPDRLAGVRAMRKARLATDAADGWGSLARWKTGSEASGRAGVPPSLPGVPSGRPNHRGRSSQSNVCLRIGDPGGTPGSAGGTRALPATTRASARRRSGVAKCDNPSRNGSTISPPATPGTAGHAGESDGALPSRGGARARRVSSEGALHNLQNSAIELRADVAKRDHPSRNGSTSSPPPARVPVGYASGSDGALPSRAGAHARRIYSEDDSHNSRNGRSPGSPPIDRTCAKGDNPSRNGSTSSPPTAPVGNAGGSDGALPSRGGAHARCIYSEGDSRNSRNGRSPGGKSGERAWAKRDHPSRNGSTSSPPPAPAPVGHAGGSDGALPSRGGADARRIYSEGDSRNSRNGRSPGGKSSERAWAKRDHPSRNGSTSSPPTAPEPVGHAGGGDGALPSRGRATARCVYFEDDSRNSRNGRSPGSKSSEPAWAKRDDPSRNGSTSSPPPARIGHAGGGDGALPSRGGAHARCIYFEDDSHNSRNGRSRGGKSSERAWAKRDHPSRNGSTSSPPPARIGHAGGGDGALPSRGGAHARCIYFEDDSHNSRNGRSRGGKSSERAWAKRDHPSRNGSTSSPPTAPERGRPRRRRRRRASLQPLRICANFATSGSKTPQIRSETPHNYPATRKTAPKTVAHLIV